MTRGGGDGIKWVASTHPSSLVPTSTIDIIVWRWCLFSSLGIIEGWQVAGEGGRTHNLHALLLLFAGWSAPIMSYLVWYEAFGELGKRVGCPFSGRGRGREATAAVRV